VPPLPPGVNDEDLELFLVESDAVRVCTLSCLDALLDGTSPCRGETVTRDWETRVTAPEPDDEEVRLRDKLNRAPTRCRKAQAGVLNGPNADDVRRQRIASGVDGVLAPLTTTVLMLQ
jgi:hypothetical protein